MSRLTFLGGPPGVGKSTVARRLLEVLPSCAWLDADDVWRFRPFIVTEETTRIAEQNVVAVLRGHLRLPVTQVILTWVLHRDDIVERLVAALGRAPDHHLALVCSPAALAVRLTTRGHDPERALERLHQVRQTRATLVDTTDMSVEDVVRAVESPLDRSLDDHRPLETDRLIRVFRSR